MSVHIWNEVGTSGVDTQKYNTSANVTRWISNGFRHWIWKLYFLPLSWLHAESAFPLSQTFFRSSFPCWPTDFLDQSICNYNEIDNYFMEARMYNALPALWFLLKNENGDFKLGSAKSIYVHIASRKEFIYLFWIDIEMTVVFGTCSPIN